MVVGKEWSWCGCREEVELVWLWGRSGVGVVVGKEWSWCGCGEGVELVWL